MIERWGFIFLLMAFYFTSCSPGTSSETTKIILKNSSGIALTAKPIMVKREDVKQVPTGEFYPLITTETADTIPAQLDDLNGDDVWDELFFLTNLAAGQEVTYHLNWVESELKFEKQTSIRFGVRQTADSKVKPEISDTFYADQLPGVIGYQHYQTDGPTWENDKIAYRIYLDGRNSIDVFGKIKKDITPENVGIGNDGVTENNYSVMKDWGTDILAVGNSVGIGGVGLIIKDSLARLGVTEQDALNNVDSTIFRITSEGQVRSVMHFTYKNWKPLDRIYNVEATTSIWPGTYAFHNSVHFNNLKGDETLLVGLVNSMTDKQLTEIAANNKWVVLLTHDKQSINKEWWLGLALILPKENYLGYINAPKTGKLSNSYFGKLKIQNNKPISYYALAAWELSDKGFRDPAYFSKYVNNLVNQLSADVKVTVE